MQHIPHSWHNANTHCIDSHTHMFLQFLKLSFPWQKNMQFFVSFSNLSPLAAGCHLTDSWVVQCDSVSLCLLIFSDGVQIVWDKSRNNFLLRQHTGMDSHTHTHTLQYVHAYAWCVMKLWGGGQRITLTESRQTPEANAVCQQEGCVCVHACVCVCIGTFNEKSYSHVLLCVH